MREDCGIIYDMDNTILASRIDFTLMKKRVLEFLQPLMNPQILDSSLPVGQIIESAVEMGLSKEEQTKVWQLVGSIEALGMEGVVPESDAYGAMEVLNANFRQFVLTNNAMIAAKAALEKTSMVSYFDEIYARESMPFLKPSPEGVEMIKAAYPRVKKWLLIGDASIDGQAARGAEIAFAAYGNKTPEYWQEHGVQPELYIRNWRRENVLCILKWFFD